MNHTQATQYIKATLAAFGPCNEASGIQLTQETWAKLHEAMSVLIEQPAQQEPVATDVGQLEYKGNSVGYIYQKMQAYRLAIDDAWSALRVKSIHPDGKTSLADMIARHTSPPYEATPLASQRSVKPWVGLEEEEIGIIAMQSQDGISPCDDTLRFARAIEEKLKEKNNG